MSNTTSLTQTSSAPKTRVLVFGPTGQVGRYVALTAHRVGAHVTLAMRDPSKPISSLAGNGTEEQNFPRVKADLTDPASLTTAVTSTQSTHAFLYLPFNTPDFMRSAAEALRSAGITFVVFLSSSTITTSIDSVTPTHPISYGHAQVEKNLRDVFGPGGYVAIRGGYFASNTKLWKAQLASGEMKIKCAEARFDFISGEDVGSVAGVILAKGPKAVEGKGYIEVVGNTLISQREAAGILGRVLGKQLKFAEPDEEEVVRDIMRDMHCPEPVARYISGVLEAREKEEDGMYEGVRYEEGGKNIERFLGRVQIPFEAWAEENKELFL
ncbi:NmrA-like family protein [Cercophora newfieldiana]|uniref:NmrA-like family protein n=1 Tax=Cercophora newfieldiana TaxID=92897 RepID=A0AA40CTR8_9PEZI|nr:NmrA-like family protein [Cercophora newfieldiana]